MKQSGLILLLAFSLAACSKKTVTPPAHSQQDTPPGEGYVLPPNSKEVATAVVKPRPLPEYLEVPAHLEPDPTRVIRVYSPVGGRLIAMRVLPGERVAAGQTLAILESGDVSAALAAYAKSKTDLQLKQEALGRASDLYKHNAIALKDLEQAQADFSTSQADIENARRQLSLLDVNPSSGSSQIRVAAPRAGVVLQISAAAGQYSKSLDSSDPLCVLADLSTVWAAGDLLEQDLSYVKAGDPAELTLVAYPGKTWKGRVNLISSTVDPATRTLRLRVVLPNRGAMLRPDMFGTLRLLRSTHVGVAVPATAVVREGNANYVYVEQSPGHFAPQAVTLGEAVGDNDVEIVSGLKPSETIVIQDAILLRGATP